MSCTVKDVMSVHVIAVGKSTPYKDIAAMLREQRVSAFPVIDDDHKVIGIVSETDLLSKEAFAGTVPKTLETRERPCLRSQVNAVTAADLMTTSPATIGPDEPLTEAARVLYEQRVNQLPVISADGSLLGIVSRSDVLSVYGRPDAQLKHQVIQDLILDEGLCDPGRFALAVQDGIVTVEGTPEASQIGYDIIDAVRRMEGVVFVRDRLRYPLDSPYLPKTSTEDQWP